jgi:hypothetical protein
MTGFWEVLRADFASRGPFVFWAVLTVIVALAGPFGSYETLALMPRLAFWAVLIGLAIVTATLVRAFVRGTLDLQGFGRGSLLIAALLALVFPPAARAFAALVMADSASMPPSTGELALFVFCTALGIGAYRHGMRLKAEPPPAADADPQSVRLMQRLPPESRGALISISVRDHYVDVVTEKGQASLLMRLSDAVAETEGVDGAQVHRSHWVAWTGVLGLLRDGTRLSLSMQGGGVVPVSKTYRAAVEARGIGMARAD